MTAAAGLLAAAALLAPASPEVGPSSVVSGHGVGPIEIGMTEARAERAGGIALVGSAPGAGCRYVRPRDRTLRFSLMLVDDRVVRVDLDRRGLPATGGLRVGDTERAVRRRFAGRLAVSPAKYRPGGRVLEVLPRGGAHRNRRVLFETDGRRVTAVRAGRLPEVRHVERCG